MHAICPHIADGGFALLDKYAFDSYVVQPLYYKLETVRTHTVLLLLLLLLLGSVFGPILLLLYTADLLQLVKRHQLTPHAYADDTQIYGYCRPADSTKLTKELSACVDEVSAWMASN